MAMPNVEPNDFMELRKKTVDFLNQQKQTGQLLPNVNMHDVQDIERKLFDNCNGDINVYKSSVGKFVTSYSRQHHQAGQPQQYMHQQQNMNPQAQYHPSQTQAQRPRQPDNYNNMTQQQINMQQQARYAQAGAAQQHPVRMMNTRQIPQPSDVQLNMLYQNLSQEDKQRLGQLPPEDRKAKIHDIWMRQYMQMQHQQRQLQQRQQQPGNVSAPAPNPNVSALNPRHRFVTPGDPNSYAGSAQGQAHGMAQAHMQQANVPGYSNMSTPNNMNEEQRMSGQAGANNPNMPSQQQHPQPQTAASQQQQQTQAAPQQPPSAPVVDEAYKAKVNELSPYVQRLKHKLHTAEHTDKEATKLQNLIAILEMVKVVKLELLIRLELSLKSMFQTGEQQMVESVIQVLKQPGGKQSLDNCFAHPWASVAHLQCRVPDEWLSPLVLPSDTENEPAPFEVTCLDEQPLRLSSVFAQELCQLSDRVRAHCNLPPVSAKVQFVSIVFNKVHSGSGASRCTGGCGRLVLDIPVDYPATGLCVDSCAFEQCWYNPLCDCQTAHAYKCTHSLQTMLNQQWAACNTLTLTIMIEQWLKLTTC